MAISYNPRTITDGLVLALDAGNPKSYPGSGTTWTDLTGDGTNKKIYVNGSLAATSATLTGTVTQNNTGNAYIGIYGSFAGYPFNGRKSETLIYNRALSLSEIQENFDLTKTRYGL